MSADIRCEIAEKSFVIQEERSFHSRARADREAGLWMAGRLGLDGDAAASFAKAAVEAGVRAPGGRGGFDHLARHLVEAGLNAEQLRTRYALCLAVADMPQGAFAATAPAQASRRHS